MVRVAPINLAYTPRVLWFDPGALDIAKGMPVVVETARGIEFGRAAEDVIEVPKAKIDALKSPLKPVLRIADAEDEAQAAEMERLSAEALPAYRELAAESGVEMRPISVEYLLDGDKAIFYFEAEERVDFRDLVRKLAAKFHVRIDMRQIGVRDEARMVGGIAHCGQELCCKRLGGDFNPVSIRMAKEQDLSLNPQKISGLCGRLMCCLRYEFDAYKEFKSRAPKQNATVQTPAGPAKVVDLDVPREIVSVRVEGEKPVRVPLASFDPPAEGNRPSVIGKDAWCEAVAGEATGYSSEGVLFATSQFTTTDKLAVAGSVRHTGGGAKSAEGKRGSGQRSGGKAAKQPGDAPSRRSRGSRKAAAHTGAEQGAKAQAAGGAEEGRKLRRRRSTKISAGTAEAPATEPARRDEAAGGRGRPAARKTPRKEASAKDASRKDANRKDVHRRESARKDAPHKPGKAEGEQAQPTRVRRPGQRSSGLSRERTQEQGGTRPADAPKAEGQRKPRRRRTSRPKEGGEHKNEG